jgi:hypothetical protein
MQCRLSITVGFVLRVTQIRGGNGEEKGSGGGDGERQTGHGAGGDGGGKRKTVTRRRLRHAPGGDQESSPPKCAG